MYTAFLLAVTACLATLALVPGVIALTTHLQWHDQPDHRKEHCIPVPTMGGLAVYTGALVAAFFLIPGNDWQLMLLGISSTMLLVTGILDDRFGLPVSLRFLLQMALGTALCFFGIRVESFNGIMGIWLLPEPIQWAITIVATVGIINAFNLIDGIDGLLSGLGMSSIAVMAVYLIKMGETPVALAALAWCGGLLGFYWFNAHPARIFIGDTGSLITGFIAAMLGMMIIHGNTVLTPNQLVMMPNAPVVVFGILSVPVLDCVRVFLTRMQRGKSPFSADKSHIHHLLTTAGMNHKMAVSVLLGYQALLLAVLTLGSAIFYPVLLVFVFAGYIVAVRVMKINLALSQNR